MRTYLSIRAVLFFATIIFWITACDKPESMSSIRPGADSHEQEADSLFRRMGILKVPHITIPVEFTLMDLEGKKVSLSNFRGKIVFLNFWTTWCPSCREEMPSMEKLHQRLKGKDFVMLAVNLQEPASRVRRFFQDYKLTFTALLDSNGELGSQFGIRSIPTTFVLDRDGRIIGAAMGAREWGSKNAVALFEHLIEKG